MKSALQRSLLVLAMLAAAQVKAEDEGGEGCLPGGFVNPGITFGTAGSLVDREVIGPVNPEPPIGANCNSVRVRAALPGSVPGLTLEWPPLDHTFMWEVLPTEAMRNRTLYIRAKPDALSSSEPLRMEIYRQSFEPVNSARGSAPIELQVLLVRAQPSNDPIGEPVSPPTEVWVIAHDARRQLGFLRTQISLQAAVDQSCERNQQRFGACVNIDANEHGLYVSLRGSSGNSGAQSMILPAAVVSKILLGNVYTSAGRSTDRFNLAHAAEYIGP